VTIGYGGERIASYEAGRVAMPYEVFRAINSKFFLSPEWLATGIGEAKMTFPFDDTAIASGIKKRTSFSQFYDQHQQIVRDFVLGKALDDYAAWRADFLSMPKADCIELLKKMPPNQIYEVLKAGVVLKRMAKAYISKKRTKNKL
jgi:hypothetical protein